MAALKSVIALFILGISPAHAEPLDLLAKKIEAGVRTSSKPVVAVLGFPYLDKKTSPGSRLIQERLTTRLAPSKKIHVVERHLLEKILREFRFESTGAVDAASTHSIGKLLGVDAIVTGTLHDRSGAETEVNARLIETRTGTVMAAASVNVIRDWDPIAPAVPPPPAAKHRDWGLSWSGSRRGHEGRPPADHGAAENFFLNQNQERNR